MPHTVLGHPVTASVLITDPRDRLLIVHPKGEGKPWQLPGGIVEQGESPLDGARREGREELGLDLDLQEHDLFAIEWLQATRRDRLASCSPVPSSLPRTPTASPCSVRNSTHGVGLPATRHGRCFIRL